MKQGEQQHGSFGAERPKRHFIHKLLSAIVLDIFKAVIIVLITMFSIVNSKILASQYKGTSN